MHGPWLVHSLRVNITKDYYVGGHSHFGGAAYVGLLYFSAPLSPNDPIFFFKSMALAQRSLIASFDLSPKASNFSISTANWLFQVNLCTIIRNSILGIFMGPKRLSPKDPKITLPNVPIKMQSLTKRPHTFFLFFSHQMPLGVKTGALYLYCLYQFHIYESPGLCHFFVIQFQNRLYSLFKHLHGEHCSG